MSTLSHVFRRDLARKLGNTAHLSPNLALSSFRSYARLVQRAPSFFSPAGVARSGLPYTPSSRRWATSTTPHSTASDPAEIAAIEYLEQGTQKLEDGDVQGAKELYQRSVDIKRNASSLFNLGVTHYHLKEFDEAISAWKESVELQPSSPDAHTNLANAYIVSPLARPDLALNHLQIAVSLAPEDPEIAFNLAAVLEACGRLEDALFYYKRSKQFGVDRAEMHIRNVSAKILGQRMREAEVEVRAGDKPDSDKT